MEQLQFEIKVWKEALMQDLQDSLVKVIDDPELSSFLSVEKLGDEKFTGISVKAKSSVAIRLQFRKKTKSFFEFRLSNSKFYNSDEILDFDDEWNKIELDKPEDIFKYIEPIAETYVKVLMEFEHEAFGCCSRYVECSDAKQCIHPSKIKSQSCQYRVQLERGNIFYGKNKNG